MKKIFRLLSFLLIAGAVIFISCKKETSCEGCREGNKPPTAVAGPDQVITLPTDSVSLDGSTSSDPDGTISNWLWTKISGPASFNITTQSDSISKVKTLVAGTYQFELKVTDNGGLSAKDTVRIIVNSVVPTNHPPIANAGRDTTITLPTNTVNLDGSGSSDSDNNITSYLWTKISGPSSFNIANVNTAQTQVTNLVEGVYQFELKVTDAGGLFSKDTMQANVNSQPPPPNNSCLPTDRPIINAQLIPVGNLSIARSGMATATIGNKIFFAGGLGNSPYFVDYSSSVDIYDITTQTWSTATLSDGRTNISTVSAGNKIFFGGGFAGGATDLVDIYDVSANTWTVDHLSLPGYDIAAAAVGNKVFFAGGFYDDSDRTNRVDIYDMNTQTWSTSVLSEGRYLITPVTANNKIYFSGGVNYDAHPVSISDRIDIYDNATNSWSVSSLVESKYIHAGIAAASKIYWAGGLTSSGFTASCLVEIKDVNTGNSSIQHLSKPGNWVIDGGQNAVAKDNKIVFFGHYSWNGQNVKFDIYDISTNSWSIGILPVNIEWASIISVNNTIYLAGGKVNGVLSNQVWKLEF